jgi:hypothetical protein
MNRLRSTANKAAKLKIKKAKTYNYLGQKGLYNDSCHPDFTNKERIIPIATKKNKNSTTVKEQN